MTSISSEFVELILKELCTQPVNFGIREFTYYKMNNLDNRISNPDQLLTTDVVRFCSSITELYSNISKPLLDIIIYVQRLTATIGGQVSR